MGETGFVRAYFHTLKPLAAVVDKKDRVVEFRFRPISGGGQTGRRDDHFLGPYGHDMETASTRL